MYAALKAGAKIHGEPKERDSISGYYSAAVIDFDGNSIEAVYRSGNSVGASETAGPTIALLEDRSAVSKSRTASIAPPRSEAKARAVSKAPTFERSPPLDASHRSQGPPPSYTMQTVPKTDDGNQTAKTIVGTLIGAAAGAAIAYALMGDSQSSSSSSSTTNNPPPQYTPESHQLMGPSQSSHAERPVYRAIEAPPRSVYTSASGPRSTRSRSVSSKNPRASTVYEGPEFIDEKGRRASDGSIFSIPEDRPCRAIELPPSNSSGHRYPCNPSTLISSYAGDKPRSRTDAGSIHSESTIKASPSSSCQRRHSHDDRTIYTTHSQHSKSHRKPKPGSTTSTLTARTMPLPTGSTATYYTTHSKRSPPSDKSYVSARAIPLPESVLGLELDAQVTPDDSISQVGSRSAYSRGSASKTRSRTSRHSRSKFEDPVRPADSVSQVSRASRRTVQAGSTAGSQASHGGSRRGSRVV